MGDERKSGRREKIDWEIQVGRRRADDRLRSVCVGEE
jgi:hypothetical protein